MKLFVEFEKKAEVFEEYGVNEDYVKDVQVLLEALKIAMAGLDKGCKALFQIAAKSNSSQAMALRELHQMKIKRSKIRELSNVPEIEEEDGSHS